MLRKRVIDALSSRDWWETATHQLKREYAVVALNNIDPPASRPDNILPTLEVPERVGRAKQDRTASNHLPAARGQVSRDRDFDALKLAKQWDDEQRDWTQKQLAQSLDVDRSQIFGKKDGRYRCPNIASYWNARQAEKQARKDNMRKHNRTTEVTDDNENEL